MKIVSDSLLRTTSDDLGVKVVDEVLHAPPELVRLLNRIGIKDAAYLPSVVEDMPSLFVQELGISRGSLRSIQEALSDQLEQLTGPIRNDFVMPPLGAMIHRAKKV